ncbi:uncharacterized protein A4U43_C07F16350 [Asparagus officinalis]|uniref:Uncharacterized protein n=1 Tax=Asparagus officinalis TaxID=4686 RepID=A0A5P1EEE0_ASPOF|nr:uncharacterized protein A4U43_C07F16350 [Asparagus officinalis]
MANMAELTRLFAQLATNLQRPTVSTSANPSSSDNLSSAISSIVASLNSQTLRNRVLDAAFSLMCFNSSQESGIVVQLCDIGAANQEIMESYEVKINGKVF